MIDLKSKSTAPKWLSPMLDFGPLILFFAANKFGGSDTDPTRGPLVGTAVFMVAIVIALFVSKWKLGKISPMMWMSAILVTGFGALTLWFRDPSFIQLKPTLIYLLFAVILFAGLIRGKALLKYLLEYAFSGVDETGWKKLSRNWALFFLLMAGFNEVINNGALLVLLSSGFDEMTKRPEIFSFDTWLAIKTWGVTILFFIFNMTQIPMLMRHGLKLDTIEASKE
jgi:intracellular septation protein